MRIVGRRESIPILKPFLKKDKKQKQKLEAYALWNKKASTWKVDFRPHVGIRLLFSVPGGQPGP